MKPRSALRILCAGIFLTLLATSTVSAIQVRYQVDLSVQIALGNFNPGTDNVFISGNFSNPTWQSAVNTIATNYILAPSGTNANVYVGTFEIATAPGGWEDHKFVLTGGNTCPNANHNSCAPNCYCCYTHSARYANACPL